MTRGDDERRLDIIDACSSLADVVDARGTVTDEILLRAAERLLEIIGEAATKCSVEFRAVPRRRLGGYRRAASGPRPSLPPHTA